ncbi:NIPSNAP family protein [Bailinhaonella thermotolerans]|uniref:NIPSNAP family containing protein n=1 Tax=Bailinhaonella thermotolerans TaxID=1070861 RepID=A0A3A4BVY4_9ACTN|nr:NIPSNAP family protein [Bailinhaonella thermotolerans]RJL35758.1 NIPSNAP family containing protein [Bailinhaonella thermotolerans]
MNGSTQLRVYTVREGLLDEWAGKWRELVVPLRLEFGFEIHGAWLDREKNQFIWLLSYAGPESFAERNAQYWASPQRKRMGLDPKEYLLKTEVREVEPVASSGA